MKIETPEELEAWVRFAAASLGRPFAEHFNMPSSYEQAAEWAASGADAMLVAGGTDLFPNMKRRQFEPKVLVGLRGLRELRGVRVTDGGLTIGAGTTLTQVATHPDVARRYPALATAWRMLQNQKITRKHIILLSDGDTAPADFDRLLKRMQDAKITVSTVTTCGNRKSVRAYSFSWAHAAPDSARTPNPAIQSRDSRMTLLHPPARTAA